MINTSGFVICIAGVEIFREVAIHFPDSKPNGAAEKPKALTIDIGLIRVVVRREASSNHADCAVLNPTMFAVPSALTCCYEARFG